MDAEKFTRSRLFNTLLGASIGIVIGQGLLMLGLISQEVVIAAVLVPALIGWWTAQRRLQNIEESTEQ